MGIKRHICKIAHTKCESYNAGECMSTNFCNKLDALSIPNAEYAILRYAMKILDNQEKLMRQNAQILALLQEKQKLK